MMSDGQEQLSEGIEKAVWDLIQREAMYTELDLEDKDTKNIISDALNKIAKELTKDQ